MMNSYQLDYASGRPQMYDNTSRIQKASRIVKALEYYFGKKLLKSLTVLDVGASTGILDNLLADNFKSVTGIDIDDKAIRFARKNFNKKNLKFETGDAMKLKYKDNSFDVVICAQVYEHVPNVDKLFSEIHRVLKDDGVCYLAALNSLWPMEPHYNLPFLSILPKSLANNYVQLFGKARIYYETPRSYWELRAITRKFELLDLTKKIFNNPKKFGYNDSINGPVKTTVAKFLSPLTPIIAPTFFWILKK